MYMYVVCICTCMMCIYLCILMIRFVKHPDISMMGGKELRWWSSRSSFNNDIYDFERYLDVADIAVPDILHSIR